MSFEVADTLDMSTPDAKRASYDLLVAQVRSVLEGERDYSLIKGCTGPLVYPAGHVYIYTALYWITEQGHNILRAQWIFVALYLATLGLVLLCYRETRVAI